jgi:hypothetical protein
LGNHDEKNRNWAWDEELLERETYYAYNNYDITWIVLNKNSLSIRLFIFFKKKWHLLFY